MARCPATEHRTTNVSAPHRPPQSENVHVIRVLRWIRGPEQTQRGKRKVSQVRKTLRPTSCLSRKQPPGYQPPAEP